MARISIILLVLFLVGCSGSKNLMTNEESNELETIIAKGNFAFEADWAFPRVTNSLVQLSNAGILAPGNSAGRISLLGNANFITFKNDSIHAYLPFFGERQLSGGYNNDLSIKFEEGAEELTYEPNKKNTSFELKFSGSDHTEKYRVFLTIFPNKTASVFITSSHRSPISYSGLISVLPETTLKEKVDTVFN